MNILQQHLSGPGWKNMHTTGEFNPAQCQLVLAFGSREMLTQASVFDHLAASFPAADIVSVSTAGEIMGDAVHDDTVAVTAIEFSKTKVKSVALEFDVHGDSLTAGKELMNALQGDDLTHVMILSDGTRVNGSELIAGCNSNNPGNVSITGGLAGDGDRFIKTVTGLNSVASEGKVIAIGFYGKNLQIGHGSMGGWDEFGHERTITKSDKNVLYEIDNVSAINLYKEYLGDYVSELPGSALLFPLSLRNKEQDNPIVRTILSINDADASMTFAGNMPEGSKVRLMKANFDKLIEGSGFAAQHSFSSFQDHQPELAICISCVGRKLILRNRVDEEVEAAREIFGAGVPISGFYSYGEISPFRNSTTCELHNQTMTITTFAEN